MSATYLELALRDAHMVELRHRVGERWTSLLFDDLDLMRDAVRTRYAEGDLYISLNRPSERPVPNGESSALRNEDIERVVRLPIDFDPARPPECMATEDELRLALGARDRFVAAMRAGGWPMPLVAMSGSGAHAMYRCSIPASSEFREMLAAVYRGWREDFATDAVEFDTSVRNAGRIFRCYGTWNRKGPDTPERPWRQASCALPAGEWQAVQLAQVEALANRYGRRRTPPAAVRRAIVAGAGDYTTLDIVAWTRAHGLYKRHLEGGKHAITCPWIADHSTEDHPLKTDTVVWEARPGVWPSFFCAHAHCDGRDIRALLEHLGDADAYCSRVWARSAA